MNPDVFSLEGKTVLVTGASSGIGQSVAIQSSLKGARVVVHGRNEERLQQTLGMLYGEGHLSIVSDISTSEGVEKIVAEAPELDGYVNSA